MTMAQLSIIIPTLNEEKLIERTLIAVQENAPHAEILVVDGGSADATVARASKHARVISTRRGRGGQLNAGIKATQGDIMLFLHADTIPDKEGITAYTINRCAHPYPLPAQGTPGSLRMALASGTLTLCYCYKQTKRRSSPPMFM